LPPAGSGDTFGAMRPVAAALLASLLAAAPAAAAPRDPERARGAARPAIAWGVASGMHKLRPGDPLPRARAIELAAARGECESAQIAVRPATDLAALSAEASPLEPARGRDGGPPTVALYRVDVLRLAKASGLDGEAGPWPDPLVPARDAWFGERRRAFPVAVAAGALQAIWVEVCVPGGAAPGSYRGAVQLADGRRAIARVPVELTVWPLELPATSSFPVTFGVATRLVQRALDAEGDPEVARAVAAAALRHRITPHGLTFDPPSGRCTAAACSLDWRAYDAEVGPVLDGTLVAGARGTFADARIPDAVWSGPDADAIALLRAWREHFEEKGWADRLWLYTLDEPAPERLPELARRARLARAAGVRVLATTIPAPPLAGVVATFCPNVTFFEPAGAAPLLTSAPARGAPEPARAARRFEGTDGPPFWYASCLSHGCGEAPERGPQLSAFHASYRGWPGYEIDRPSAAARAMAWLGWRERVRGELYYDMVHAWRGDPWADPRAFAGNGDGTLLYPGTTARFGGTRPFPVESIRLKVIRDGLEDLELLRLAEARGLGSTAERIAARVAGSLRGFAREPEAWLAARRELAQALVARRARSDR
jgi:hypothetical protein